MRVQTYKQKIIDSLALNDKVKGIAQCGELNTPLIKGNSDIDMFVLCTEIPEESEREAIYQTYASEEDSVMINVCCGGIWGYGDIILVDGIDVMFMYFTVEEMAQYLKETLDGQHLDRESGFYPIGRLATIESINILYEIEDTWTDLVKLVKQPPEDCYGRLINIVKNAVSPETIPQSVEELKALHRETLELSQQVWRFGKCILHNNNLNQSKTIMIKPLEGIVIDGNMISLGAPMEEVESVLGNGNRMDQSEYYYENELRFDYDNDGRVEFIECLGGVDGKVQPVIEGKTAFQIDADELCELLRKQNGQEVPADENDYDAVYPAIGVGLYRDITPSDVEEMIKDMIADGIDVNDNEDLKNDQHRCNHWATLGIGLKTYYQNS